jgi:hypothetical protein
MTGVQMHIPMAWCLHRPGPSRPKETQTDFEFINTAAPGESTSTIRKAVRVHVMRQYHKRSRERVAGTDRRRDQSDNTILPEDLTNREPGAAMTLAPASSTGTQIESFRFPMGIPREDTCLHECNPASADAGGARKSMRFLDSASHSEATHARFLLPRFPPNSVRPGPTPPFPGVSKMDTSSLKLLRFCK